MNKVILMGRLTKDPEVRYSQGNNAMAIGKFSIAVDRRLKREGQPEADFFNCTAFGKLGEFVEKYLKKGTKITMIGQIQNNDYTDNAGTKHYAVQIIAEEIEFAEKKSEGGSSAPVTDQDGFMNIPEGIDEELPFARP